MTEMPSTNELSRLRWQCRRGMLELDALLGEFVEQHYTKLDEREKNVFKDILEFPDQLLFDYFFGNGKSIDKDVNNVIERIRYAITPEA
ncbi:MAG: succinate dehydrogenase assembly factor 2 [Thioalkalispiraceae bacterium]|jgi:antitoxin CptB